MCEEVIREIDHRTLFLFRSDNEVDAITTSPVADEPHGYIVYRLEDARLKAYAMPPHIAYDREDR